MKRYFGLLLAGIMLTLLVIAAVPVVAAADGQISGAVLNGSDNGTPLAGMVVTLTLFDDLTAAAEFEATTDAAGTFEFSGLETGPTFSYQLDTEYDGVPYDSGFLQFEEEETQFSWDIWVYETTTDNSHLSLAMAHVIMAAGEGYLSVTEYHIFVNDSDLAYVGPPDGSGEVLRFTLPAGAAALDFSEGLTDVRMLSAGNGFADAAPFWPGMREVVFTYVIPLTAGKNPLTLEFDYPVMALNLLVEDQGFGVSTTLTEGEPLMMEARRFLAYSGQDIAAGEPLTLTVDTGGSAAAGVGVWVWVLVALAVGAAGVFIIWFRRRGAAPQTVSAGEDDADLELFQALAQLDDDFEAGKITEAAYQEQRTEIKARLVGLMRRDGSEETP